MIQATIDELQHRVQLALSESPIYSLRELKVEYTDGVLHLQGCVSSFYHKQLAQETIRSVAGNVEVMNLVYVRETDESSREVEW